MVLAEVPEEVMMSEILTRLPVSSILRFRCVCKQWCSSMATPQFIREHLRKSKSSSSSNNRRIMIAGYHSSGFVFKSMSVHSKPPFSSCLVAYNNYPWSNRNPAKIQGSCDGLFYLTTRSVPGIHIWNPSTREHKTLPSFMKKGWCGIGFGYDHSIHAFKVFVMRSCGVEQIQVHVYTLETTTTTTSCSGSLLSDDSCSEALYQIPSDFDSDDPGPFIYSEYEYLYESESESETEPNPSSNPCFGEEFRISLITPSLFTWQLRIASIDVTKETYGEIPMPHHVQEDRHSGYLYTGFEEVFGALHPTAVRDTYTDYAILLEDELTTKPVSISHVEASAIPFAALTSWRALKSTARITQGQRVFVVNGGGAVSFATIQLAVAPEYHVSTICGSESIDQGMAAGAEQAMDYTT
ncbi:hypothetical protein ACSBR1_039622 [Camellia fascicularis]